MAFSTAASSASIAGGVRIKFSDMQSAMLGMPVKQSRVTLQRKPKLLKSDLSVRAESNDRNGGGSGEFLAGLLLGGALVGTLTIVFAPQIRRAIMHEDELGFRRDRIPIYYDDQGLEISRRSLSFKIRQLNSAIDKISSKLRSGFKLVKEPKKKTDSEIEAAM